MRFSNLKKKLLLLVGVIAAFALLGSMMLPSISEKMGLDADSCFASPPADGSYDYLKRWDNLQDCLDECWSDWETCNYAAIAYCDSQYDWRESEEEKKAYNKCFDKGRGICYTVWDGCKSECNTMY